jgi:chemotaxis protein methyltransferase CheR
MNRLKDKRRLKIWSAGCATGEEPYSIAMALRTAFWDIRNWNVTILGSDVNRTFLAKASTGVYTDWSFRSVPQRVKNTYFIRKGDEYKIVPEIRGMVQFSYLNLVKDAFPPALSEGAEVDVIFCRNVLMYFTPQRQAYVIDSMVKALPEDGWLIVGPAEASLVQHSDLTTVNFPGVVIFRKGIPKRAIVGSIQFTKPVEKEAPVGLNIAPLELPIPMVAKTTHAEAPIIAPVPDITPAPDSYDEALESYELGRYSEAIEKLYARLEEGSALNGEHKKTVLLLARSYANQGNLDEALEWAQKAVAEDVLDPLTHYIHGAVLLEKEEIDNAALAMTRALFLDPKLVVAQVALGTLARMQGKPKLAEKHYRVALKTLCDYEEDEIVPASEGMTAGRFMEVVLAMSRKETAKDEPRIQSCVRRI